MSRTELPRVAGVNLKAGIFIALLLAVAAQSETRPRYGGTLRIEMRDPITSLDPADPATSSTGKDRLMMLVYDRLTTLDKDGHPQPQLARLWDPDAQKRIWRFRIRKDAKFHDGSPVTVADVMGSLEAVAPEWKIRKGTDGEGDMFFIELPAADPFLPTKLAQARYSIYKRSADGALLGSGAFITGDFQSGKRLMLRANDEHWGGRPYVDAVEVLMGISLGEVLRDRRLDRDDIVEAPLEQMRALTQAGQRVMLSPPVNLIAVVFTHAPMLTENVPQPKSATEDVRVRQAMMLAIDRASIQNVVLQRQGEVAQGLLPNWMTGYGFLFPASTDLEHAKQLRSEAGRIASVPAAGSTNGTLIMAIDPNDLTLRAVADRIIVNAREAGFNIQLLTERNLTAASAMKIKNVDLALVRVRVPSIEPSVALRGLAESLNLAPPDTADGSPGAVFNAERALLEHQRIAPIVFVPEAVWLHPRVHNWNASRSGVWDLVSVWLDEDRTQSQAAP